MGVEARARRDETADELVRQGVRRDARRGGGGDAARAYAAMGLPHEAVAPVAVLALQRLAGNAAVKDLVVQRAGPAPATYAPPAGLVELGATTPTSRPLGQTHPRSAPPPRWHVAGARVDGGYEGSVQPTTLGTPTIEAVYPAPGVYDLPPGETGRTRKALVDDVVSALVRDGEQEHSDDFWWAFQLAYGPVVEAINQLAARPAKRAANVRELHQAWRADLLPLLPPQLRFPLDQIAPAGSWAQVYARLLQPSYQRDQRGWHSMRQGFATVADRTAHGVGEDVELLRILPNPDNINVHSSQDRAREAFAALPPGS